LQDAVASGDTEKLIRYVRLHFGDGNEAAGRKEEIDKAWIEALKLLLDVPATNREFIFETLAAKNVCGIQISRGERRTVTRKVCGCHRASAI